MSRLKVRNNILFLKDNTAYEKSDNDLISSKTPKLIDKIAGKDLKQLESENIFVFPELLKENYGMEKGQMLLEAGNDRFRTGNVMGFIGCESERLIIESRFCGDGDDYFFQYLLFKVLNLPKIVDLKSDADQSNRLFNFLMFLFPSYLKAAMRKGLFKKYVRNSYNDDNVKGIIDIARHIKQNTPFVGKIAYNQREFSYDNYLTELVRHTIEFIKTKPYGRNLIFTVKDQAKLVADATPAYNLYDRQKIIEDNKKCPVKHAYFREYLALQRLCLLILQHWKHQIGIGAKHIYGILFDGAWLWEEYVNLLICDSFYHPQNKAKAGKNPQYLFEHNKAKIYPDFIGKSPVSRVIADAKYKPIDNISGRDYLQILAYMFRFDAKTGFFIYPRANEQDIILRLNEGSTYENNVAVRNGISVIKFGLEIPQNADNYIAFVAEMENNEKLFVKSMQKYTGDNTGSMVC